MYTVYSRTRYCVTSVMYGISWFRSHRMYLFENMVSVKFVISNVLLFPYSFFRAVREYTNHSLCILKYWCLLYEKARVSTNRTKLIFSHITWPVPFNSATIYWMYIRIQASALSTWDLGSSLITHSIWWCFLTDILGQPIGSIFKAP
jgi:hypothetical protein